jgi:4-hydroxyphenylpyruvate dioxygenase
MDKWAGFYERLFNFREIRYFDIEGKKTGLFSRAMTSPCGRSAFRSTRARTTRARSRNTSASTTARGIQHIALATPDIYATATRQAQRRRVPGHSGHLYEGVDARVAGHRESLSRMQERRILIDGSAEDGVLPADLHEERDRPIFFEIIQRKGNEGFGEGNFRALFESIELDQERRGVI